MKDELPALPALGIAIYNRPDLLAQCLRSVDYPVNTIVLVNNGGLRGLRELHYQEPHVIEPGCNLGVAGAWNAILEHVFVQLKLDSVLICGNDITWAPGDLERVMATVRDFPEADCIFGNHAFSNFLVKRSGWEKLGAFDENIEIAYLEDSDYWQRIRHTPGVKAMHAAGLRAQHGGSQTIASDPDLARRSSAQHGRNWKYYGAKWGCPPHSHAAETFTTPFGRGGPVNEWRLEGERLTRPHWFKANPEERMKDEL